MTRKFLIEFSYVHGYGFKFEKKKLAIKENNRDDMSLSFFNQKIVPLGFFSNLLKWNVDTL